MKKILLFGASGGIGKEVFEFLNNTDNEIISVVRKDCDLSDLQETNDFMDNFDQNIDWVVYCSGIIHNSEVEKIPKVKTLSESYNVNTLSPIIIFSSIQDKINKNGGIIYISSTAVFKPNSEFPLYSSSKRATESFLKTISEKFENEKNLQKKVIVIAPGPTNTPMRQNIFGDADEYQSPKFIANIIKNIIINNEYINGDFIVAKNSSLSLENLGRY